MVRALEAPADAAHHATDGGATAYPAKARSAPKGGRVMRQKESRSLVTSKRSGAPTFITETKCSTRRANRLVWTVTPCV
jgi:hypothetical protein